MFKLIYNRIFSLLNKPVPATGIGLFRIFYGLVTFQEIVFLLYFQHLIFDPIPYIDVEFPSIPMFLTVWGIAALFVATGYHYQLSIIANYIFWLIFVNFTSMQRDFDGGFDTFMIGVGFFMIFMPGDRAFSLDQLRKKLSTPFASYRSYPEAKVSALAYLLPVWICLGFLYFDSDIHKLYAPQWRNGVGPWLPATHPYYVSAIDTSALLNRELLQKVVGYSIIVFQFTFLFFFARKKLRIFYFLFGLALHLGITLTLNIYPFGLGMLICYILLVPFSWWRRIGGWLRSEQPRLTVFFDQDCPLCNRTVLTLNHFDILRRIDFRSAQEYAKQYPQLAGMDMAVLLKDLYALDDEGRLYWGVETYRQVLLKMCYPALLGWLLGLPWVKRWAERIYRRIADNRVRIACGADCPVPDPLPDNTFYHRIFEHIAKQKPKALSRKLAKIVVALILLQVNSTIHYGVFYRFPELTKNTALGGPISEASNAILMVSSTFFGITPHALYLHDHFAGYDRILAITYIDDQGQEHWLPFVNEQGRLLAPNWGRVHSMWANIAVTPTINNVRLKKFLMKVTAFWGPKTGIDLNNAEFRVKMKKIQSSTEWVPDQLHNNFTAQWVNIGSVYWKNRQISYELPEDINSL